MTHYPAPAYNRSEVEAAWRRSDEMAVRKIFARYILLMASLALAVTLYYPVLPAHLSVPISLPTPPPPHTIQEMIIVAAVAEDIPPSTALRVAWLESRYQNIVRSEGNGTKSYGPMQLNSRTFPRAPVMSVRENVEAGVRYLAEGIAVCNKQLQPFISGSGWVSFLAAGDVVVSVKPQIQRCAIDWYRGKR